MAHGRKEPSALADLSGQWIDKVHARRPPRGVVLDMDSSVSPTHGEQEMSVWNGHYECTCYHPLFVFNQFGDLERCALRPGNVHSADGWEDVLKPVVARYQGKVSRIYFRADAGFANQSGQLTNTLARDMDTSGSGENSARARSLALLVKRIGDRHCDGLGQRFADRPVIGGTAGMFRRGLFGTGNEPIGPCFGTRRDSS